MKSWDSAFNAQGSRVIIVVVQVRAVKIYVAAVDWRRCWELSTGYYQMLLLMGDLISCSSIYCIVKVLLIWDGCYTYSNRPTPWVFQTSFFEGYYGISSSFISSQYILRCPWVFVVCFAILHKGLRMDLLLSYIYKHGCIPMVTVH
jgi:hypothetical protein